MLVKRLIDLDRIWDIQDEFVKSNNINILNVSNWNCSNEFKNSFQDIFVYNDKRTLIDYIYSYTLSDDILGKIKCEYPFCTVEDEIQITPNNTVSIVYIANLLKQLGIKKVCVIAPSYFSVYSAFDLFNIKYDRISIKKNEQTYELITDKDLSTYDAVWITYPLFCGGVYLDNNFLDKITIISNDTLIITDESYCEYGQEMPRQIFLKNHIGIYSPHKSIGFNSFKFSMIVFNKKYSKLLEHWSDILCGSLNATNYNAIQHFLSNNYSICMDHYSKLMCKAHSGIQQSLLQCENLLYDKHARGNMMMIYAPRIPFKELNNEQFYWSLMSNTMGCILPGYLHDYDESCGFSFRVNLSLYNHNFQCIFNNICQYLNQYY